MTEGTVIEREGAHPPAVSGQKKYQFLLINAFSLPRRQMTHTAV